MAMLKEFREFAMRGNVVDMAVGIIIGAAFGKIVASLVADVIMPPIGILLGIELMLNSVNINLVACSRFSGDVTGMGFTVFTICITVTEAALGLAIVILLFRVRRTVTADQLDLLKG